jgi:2-polyprenyl-3-methyl-5-hydroxy-6-metoxy-1,4-benzoquinol methylase
MRFGPRWQCPACGYRLAVRVSATPGYVEGTAYKTRVCIACRSSLAQSQPASSEIYDSIYRNAQSISGYDRYARMAADVLESKDPLALLASCEDMYWGVREWFDLNGSNLRPRARVADIGSGLGYLTYALNSSGHQCRGFDLSEAAVSAAMDRFGPYYECRDVTGDVSDISGSFDVVIMLEVIEHVANPTDIIQAALNLLVPGGTLIVSTPNKSAYGWFGLWASDLPPIHIAWFTEAGVRSMGRRVGASVGFIDFTKLNGSRNNAKWLPGVRSFGPRLDAHLVPTSPDGAQMPLALLTRATLAIRLRVRKVRGSIPMLRGTSRRFTGRRSYSMVVSFVRSGADRRHVR